MATHVILKYVDVMGLSIDDQERLEEICNKVQEVRSAAGKKAITNYAIVNDDEPYYQEVVDLIRGKEAKMAKIFEFRNDVAYLIVAKDEDSAREFLSIGCDEKEMVEDKETETTELSRNFHKMITDEEDGSKMDLWDMVEKDIKKDGVRMPYVLATTI